jgi:hypothetical protein
MMPRRENPDRRRACRLQARVRVDFCPLVTRENGLRIGGMQRGVAANISQTGLLVTDVGYLRVGAVLHLFLRLPDVPANPIVCYARVVRRDNQGYGIRFIRLRQTDHHRLGRFVDDLLEAEFRRSASAAG